MNESFWSNEESAAKFRQELNAIIDKRTISVGNLTREQFIEAIIQAIACGDFQKLVTTDRQQVIYVPFGESERLKAKLSVAEARLAALANMVWETRWVSEDDDYHKLVGVAAEIRSGNMDGIDEVGGI